LKVPVSKNQTSTAAQPGSSAPSNSRRFKLSVTEALILRRGAKVKCFFPAGAHELQSLSEHPPLTLNAQRLGARARSAALALKPARPLDLKNFVLYTLLGPCAVFFLLTATRWNEIIFNSKYPN
jgi:hypothetical protein